MTKEKYEKTRKDPVRNTATTRGKEIVKEFMELAEKRKKIEFTRKERKLYEDKDNLISDAIYLFVKYLSEETGHKYNKEIFMFINDYEGGNMQLIHNHFEDKHISAETKRTIEFYKEYIDLQKVKLGIYKRMYNES